MKILKRVVFFSVWLVAGFSVTNIFNACEKLGNDDMSSSDDPGIYTDKGSYLAKVEGDAKLELKDGEARYERSGEDTWEIILDQDSIRLEIEIVDSTGIGEKSYDIGDTYDEDQVAEIIMELNTGNYYSHECIRPQYYDCTASSTVEIIEIKNDSSLVGNFETVDLTTSSNASWAHLKGQFYAEQHD